MARGLTQRQTDILNYIIDCIRVNGMPPTIAEIGATFHISSTNGVNDHLVALEKKGYITRSSKARSIHVTEQASAGLYETQVAMAPLVGRIAAGTPVLAQENVEGQVPIGARFAAPGVFALTVRGESMIEDAIIEGDTIIVDPNIQPRVGDIVVALVDDEATVKRYYRHGNMVELRPANASMQPILVPARSVRIQGIVVALQRSLR